MKAQAKKPAVKKAPVILIKTDDFTGDYPTVMEAITASIITGSMASKAERASASLVMQGHAIPSLDSLLEACQEADKAITKASIASKLSTLKTLAHIGTVLPKADAVFIAANAKGGRLSDIKTFADAVISKHGGKYSNSVKQGNIRIWDKKPTAIKAGTAEKIHRDKQSDTSPRQTKGKATAPAPVSDKLRLVALLNEIAKLLPTMEATSDIEKVSFSGVVGGLLKRTEIFK